MKRRTPTEVCIAYTASLDNVRRLTRAIGTLRCKEKAAPDPKVGFYGEESCLKDYFRETPMVFGIDPGHEDHPAKEHYDLMCDPCKGALVLILERKIARRDLGSRKRAVESVGRREAKAAQ